MSMAFGSVREAGDSRPAEVLILDANGVPVTFPTTPNAVSVSVLTNFPANTVVAFAAAAANALRAPRGVLILNDSTKSLRVAYGNVVNSSSYSVIVPAGTSWQNEDEFTGAVWAQLVSADANSKFIRVTELSRA